MISRLLFALVVSLVVSALWIKHKWQLATEAGITHIICMPNVTKQQIDAFVEDMKTNTSEPKTKRSLATMTT